MKEGKNEEKEGRKGEREGRKEEGRKGKKERKKKRKKEKLKEDLGSVFYHELGMDKNGSCAACAKPPVFPAGTPSLATFLGLVRFLIN
jgi:hypothetical protein